MMKRRMLLGAGVAVVAGGAGTLGALHWERPGVAPADEALWTQRFDTPTGGELALATWRGQPLLLNFWATWCPPCVKEMPMLDAFVSAGGALKVVGLAIDGPTPVREFLTRLPIGFPIGLAGLDGAELARSLGNSSGGLPFSALFDRHGAMHERKLGALAASDLDRWSRELSAS